MYMEQASGKQPPNAKNVIPITESGIKNVCPVISPKKALEQRKPNYIDT